MKAEHRKELRTNVLAASVNRLAEQLKRPPKRRTLLWVLLGIVLVSALGIYWWYQRNKARGLSERWFLAYYLEPQVYQQILRNYPRSRPTQAARLQQNWQLLWEATRQLPLASAEAARLLEQIQRDYEQLAEECQNFPEWGAEAAYQAAVAQEVLAFQDRKNLQEAERRYQKVIDEYPGTAWAEEAKDRLRPLKDPNSRQQVEQFYETLGRSVRLLPAPEPSLPPAPPKAGPPS